MSTINQRQETPGFDNPFDIKENQFQYMSIDHELVDSFPKVYIFSVDPNPHVVSKGGLGEFVISAKEEGQRYSKPLVITGKHAEHMHLGLPVSPVHYEDGLLLAKDIVGVMSADKGLGRHTSNLEWHGVFFTRNETPTKKEIETAEEKRRQYLVKVAADGDAKFMRGQHPDAFERAACHELKLKKSWAENPTAMESCPACGSGVLPNVAVCAHCNAVLDEDKARKFFPGRFPAPEPVATGAPKK